MILLSDANILMDLGHIEAVAILPRLGSIEVLDVVLSECQHHSQPDLVQQIIKCGIKIIATKYEWLSLIDADPMGRLSVQDSLNLYYAQAFGRVLLTNEKRLRQLCVEQEVVVHGTLWILKEAYDRKVEHGAQICKWLETLAGLDRRLPKEEVVSLRKILGCL